MIQYAEASVKMDALNIVEDSKRWLKVKSTIVRSGVYDYPDGVAFKPASELVKSVKSATYAKLVVGHHPETMVVMSQDDIYGGIEKPFWENNKMRAVMSFDKRFTPPDFLDRVRNAAKGIAEMLNASIGFYFRNDHTPGVGPDVNTGKMRKYDYKMRNIMIDHVAVGDFKGRCRAPQCGVGLGLDETFTRISIGTSTVVKRGDQWCIIHTHGEKAGTLVKGSCHKNKAETEAMHRAIMAQKHGAQEVNYYKQIHAMVNVDSLTDADYALFFGATERPSKAWMESCILKAKSFADEPGAFCNWLFNNGPEKLKRGFGSSSVSNQKGGKNMSQETEGESEYDKCIKEKKAEGMSDDEAAEACKALKPTESAEDEEKTEKTPWQKCLAKYTSKGTPLAEAIQKCKKEGIVQTDQEETEVEAFNRCVKGKQEIEGMTLEEAREACKPQIDQGEVETPAEETEELPTPLEQCVATRMESHGEDEATATTWCKDELAGLHEPTESIVGDIAKLAKKDDKLNRQHR